MRLNCDVSEVQTYNRFIIESYSIIWSESETEREEGERERGGDRERERGRQRERENWSERTRNKDLFTTIETKLLQNSI